MIFKRFLLWNTISKLAVSWPNDSIGLTKLPKLESNLLSDAFESLNDKPDAMSYLYLGGDSFSWLVFGLGADMARLVD